MEPRLKSRFWLWKSWIFQVSWQLWGEFCRPNDLFWWFRKLCARQSATGAWPTSNRFIQIITYIYMCIYIYMYIYCLHRLLVRLGGLLRSWNSLTSNSPSGAGSSSQRGFKGYPGSQNVSFVQLSEERKQMFWTPFFGWALYGFVDGNSGFMMKRQ